MQINCPRCVKMVEWEGNEWRPFCSERCKLLDLGAWASEKYSLPEEPISEESLKLMNGIDEEK